MHGNNVRQIQDKGFSLGGQAGQAKHVQWLKILSRVSHVISMGLSGKGRGTLAKGTNALLQQKVFINPIPAD